MMDNLLTFEEIKESVQLAYPLPIASVFRRTRTMGRENLGGRHKALIDLFEVFAKFICIAQLQEARQCVSNLKDRLPQKEKTLEFLKRPTLGEWIGLLRILNKTSYGSQVPFLTENIRKWYSQTQNIQSKEVLGLLAGIDGLNFDRKTKTPNAELCNALVTYRNKKIGHAANLLESELTTNLRILEHVLAHLVTSAEFLKEMHLFNVERVEVADNNRWLVHAAKLTGLSDEPVEYTLDEKLNLSELYLIRADTRKQISSLVPMCPFLLWESNVELKRKEIYFYNDAWRTKLEYISYSSGSYYYHKELHGKFAELITLKLQPGVKEDPHHLLSQEERSERAEHYYKRAMFLKNEERFEDALEALEVALEYDRRADVFLELAKTQAQLADPSPAILQTLQNCLDLDPENSEASALFRMLEEHIGNEVDHGVTPGEELEEIRNPTFWHVVTPRKLRSAAFLFWLLVLSSWWSLSAVLEWSQGFRNYAIIGCISVGFMGSVFLILNIFVGRHLFGMLKLPLSLQLDSMRLERFERWFELRLRETFGRFVVRAGIVDWKLTVKEDFGWYLGWLIWVLTFTPCALYLTDTQEIPFYLILTRVVDCVLLYSFGYWNFRYLAMSTWFVYLFSRLSLKPMLTKINDDGLRALGPFLSFNIMVMTIFYTLYWGMGVFGVSVSLHVLEFILAGMAVVMYVIWSLGMPIAVRRAAREAKSKAVHKYSEHIERAFQGFLNNPTEDSLARYNWLLKEQTAIRKIGVWPMSWAETVFVVLGGNLFLVAVVSWFVILRLGELESVMRWFHGFLGPP